MIDGLKTVNLTWINKIFVIGHTKMFVYESAPRYEEGIHGPIDQVPIAPSEV